MEQSRAIAYTKNKTRACQWAVSIDLFVSLLFFHVVIDGEPLLLIRSNWKTV